MPNDVLLLSRLMQRFGVQELNLPQEFQYDPYSCLGKMKCEGKSENAKLQSGVSSCVGGKIVNVPLYVA